MTSTKIERQKAVKEFVNKWNGRGNEISDTRAFWEALLVALFDCKDPYYYIDTEKTVRLEDSSRRIDCYIADTKVLIEQKSLGIDLDKPEIQSGTSEPMTPYQQAKRYADALAVDEHPRWIVTCNFEEFRIYDMAKQSRDIKPVILHLKELPKSYNVLDFLVKVSTTEIHREEDVSIEAGERIGKIYDAFLKQYPKEKQTDTDVLHSLNKLCVRLVFCLYAEDAGIFTENSFYNYLSQFPTTYLNERLEQLFNVLNTNKANRKQFLPDDLKAFPYVNGGLFADESYEIPTFTDELRTLLLENSSKDFDWSAINPTIFGAVFESTLNPETRRKNGMHYTSIENIHKVIDPLFLDGLREELENIKNTDNPLSRNKYLKNFKTKLSQLKFLDPACGSGNFLTETYLCLRRMENECLKLLSKTKDQMQLDVDGVIQVSIQQFYGIEYNDFAVNVAKTALWIAEYQMMEETRKIVHTLSDDSFLPLKTYSNIVEGNALRINWQDVVPKSNLCTIRDNPSLYIMGNPPFLGYTLQSKEQKEDMAFIFKGRKETGVLDYVAAWYQKAAEYMNGTNFEAAFVSTNSITQGEQTAILWESLINELNVSINFGYKPFRWNNETKGMAVVHCVIIGFDTNGGRSIKYIYNNAGEKKFAKNISPYIIDADNVFIHKMKKPICDVPAMVKGSIPVDDGNLIIEDKDYDEFVATDTKSAKFIKPLIGSEEFINKKKRWCLWLNGVNPSEIRECPNILNRIERVREFRLKSTKEATRKYADYPSCFMEIRQPNSEYILVPRHSSENRPYIPIGFLSPDIIATDASSIIPNATLYHFGILTSNVHMAWVRTVCGRLEMRYRYSNNIVYNNFPWPSPSLEQKSTIESAAQAVLDARAKYPESSLADLYDPLTMPQELRKAHTALDKAVLKAYGLKTENESEIVAFLMRKYQELIDNNKSQ